MSTPAERFRRANLRRAARSLTLLFGVGTLVGLYPLVTGLEPMAFFAPALVAVVSAVAWWRLTAGDVALARRMVTTVAVIYVAGTVAFAPPLVVLAIGFPLSFLLLALVHQVHASGVARRLGWVTVAIVVLGCLRQLLGGAFDPIEDWPLAVGTVAQTLALATAQVALGRLAQGWERALDELGTLNRRLARSYDSVLDASQAKSRFLATMSHELRTPLNAILGYAGLMQDDVEDGVLPEVRDLQRVQDAGHHLLSLVNEVLDLSRVESGRLDLELVQVDLEHLAMQVVDTLRPAAVAKGLTLTLACPVRMAPLRLDALRARQVLTNLVGNAVKFTATGGVKVRVREAATEVYIEVADTGGGIAPEALARIFEPFEQADGSVQRTYGGTGLGLAISHQLVEKMGGELTVRSTLGEGTTFVVAFPRGTTAGPSTRGTDRAGGPARS